LGRNSEDKLRGQIKSIAVQYAFSVQSQHYHVYLHFLLSNISPWLLMMFTLKVRIDGANIFPAWDRIS
jgi:hypothetical protein